MKTSAKILVVALVALVATGFGLTAVPRSEAANDGNMVQATSELLQNEATEGIVNGIGGTCHVDSRVNAYIRVYINGVYRGTMAPYGDIFPFVGDPRGSITTLYAVTTDGRFTWNRTVYNDTGDYHWILYP